MGEFGKHLVGIRPAVVHLSLHQRHLVVLRLEIDRCLLKIIYLVAIRLNCLLCTGYLQKIYYLHG